MARKRNPTADQAARFVAIRDKIQAATGLAADDPRLGYLATCELRLEQLSARVVAGDDTVSLAELQAMRAQIDESTPLAPPELTLNIVRPTDAAPPRSASVSGLRACRRCSWTPPDKDRVARCYRCGWKRGDDTSKPWQPIDLSCEPSPAPSPETLTSEAAKPDAPASPPQYPRRNPGSIHDAALPNGQPARMAPSPWRGLSVGGLNGGGSGRPFGPGVQNDPNPFK